MTETASTTQSELSEAVFWTKFHSWVCGLSAAAFVFELVRMFYQWLRYGLASDVPLRSIVSAPHVKWVGVQRIFDFVWNRELWMLALGLALLSGWLQELYDEEARKKRFQLHREETNK